MGGGYGQFENSEGGTLTVSARVSNGSPRHAMPSIPELVYAALLYKDGEIPANPESKDFVQGTATEDGKLIFSFQRPDDTSGTFTLEIFAFVKTEGGAEDDTMQFSREAALLSGSKTGLSIVGDTIEISEAIPLSSSKPGTVSLKIKVPDECSLSISETNEDGTTITESDAHFTVTGTSSDFIIMQVGEGISAGAYQVKFTVKKGDEIVHIFSEYINVINGLCTNTWWNGEKSSEVKDVASSISKTVYVRGTGGYYDKTEPYNDGETAEADDTNSGSFLSPLASIQKAIDKIIAINDSSSEYTIYVDGTLTQVTAAPMATFSALKKELTLTIKALSGTATLDGGARFDENGTVVEEGSKSRIIYAGHGTNGILNLTIENMVIKGGNAYSGGGIYISNSTLKMKDCTIEGNAATDGLEAGGGIYVSSGALTMERCTVSGNVAKSLAGGVYFKAGTLKTEKCVFSGNISKNYGGAIYISTNVEATMTDDEIKGNTGFIVGGIEVSGGTLEMKNCKVEGNIATSYCIGGVGVFSGGTVTMDGGTISGNEIRDKTTFGTNANYGGGVSVTHSGSTFTMKGDATISGNILAEVAANRLGSEVRVNGGTFEMEGGTISGGNAKLGGGVYVSGSTSNVNMSGGTITGNTATANGGGVYVEEGTFTMSGGTIDGNTATNGNGAYLAAKGKLNMSGAAQFAESDDVYLYANGSDIPTVCVAGELTALSPVAKITPKSYAAGTQVLSAGADVTIDDTICDKFALIPAPDGTDWKIVPNDDGTVGALGIESVFLDSSSGDDANSGLAASKAVKTLSKAIELFESQNAKKIMVCAAYTLPSSESTLLDRIGGGRRNLPLVRYDGSSDVSSNFTGNLLTISQGDVTITNVTLDGSKEKVTASGQLLYIDDSTTTVTLGDGATVCNNKTTQWGSGSGVHIEDGTFKMIGGTVTGNEGFQGYGLGVYINTNATFEMSGGKISGNSENYSAGGGVYDKGTFIMSGGEISGNKVGSGGGVYVTNTAAKGFFTMTGGKIINNTAKNHGGGVCVNGTFTMEDGEITGNTASSGNGVYKIGDGNFTHTGGTVQSD